MDCFMKFNGLMLQFRKLCDHFFNILCLVTIGNQHCITCINDNKVFHTYRGNHPLSTLDIATG